MKCFTIERFIPRIAVAALAGGLLATGGNALAARPIRLDAGEVIPVRLNDTISSIDSNKGDTFTATVRSTDADQYGLPAGTKVDGVVTGARPQSGNDPGVVEVSFNRIRLPDGHSYAINGSLIGLDNKSVERRSDGRLIATPSHKNDRLTYAGYGAGAGLIVGVLTKRPLEDAILGGLLGYGFSALQKGHSNARDVVLKPGTEMGVRIDRTAELTSYDQADTPRYRRDTGQDRYRVSTDRRDYGVARSSDHGYIPADGPEIGAMIDEQDVRFDSTARPFINENSIVMLPVIPVLRAANIPYTYSAHTQTLRATGTEQPVRIALGSSIAVVNGSRRIRMDAPVQRINGTIYAPMRFLELATGSDVRYDSGSRTVLLNSR
jgi:hypothetical protein